MTNHEILYFDLDRTLLDTNLFNETLWALIEERYGIDAEQQWKRAPEFFVYDRQLYSYEFFDHLKDLSLDNDEVATWLLAELRKRKLLYEDARPALDWANHSYEVRILTYGGNRYQRFKIDACPQLADIPVDIVLAPKAEFFSTHTDPAILVDDKPIAAELPGHVIFVHLERTQSEQITRHDEPKYISIKSLENIKEVL